MEVLVFFLLVGMGFALLPLAVQLLAAVIGMMLHALWRLLAFTLERGLAGFRWGMNGGLSETAAALQQAASAIAGAVAYVYSAATIFIEEWRGGAVPQPDFTSDFDFEAWQREQAERDAAERAAREEAERRAREHADSCAREEEEARRRQEQVRQEKMRQEQQRRAQEEAAQRAREQAEARARAKQQRSQQSKRAKPTPSPYEGALALLGLSHGFTQEELKRSYRAKVKSAHPDAGGSHDAMAALNAAYALLKEKRAA